MPGMMTGTQFRAFKLDVRQVDTEKPGRVVFHSSIFGKKDSYDTIFDKGCFAQTLKQHDGLLPVLWFHDPRMPIALGVHEEDDKGLLVTADLDLEVEQARNVHSGLRNGYVDCASIAFRVVTEQVEDDVIHFKEVRLWESSLLTRGFAAQAEATVDSVRAIPDAIARLNLTARDMGSEELAEAILGLRGLLDDLIEVAALPTDGRPYPNEHACRLQNPDKYKTFRRVSRKTDGKTYFVILGQKKDDEQVWENQAFRYPKTTWQAGMAQAHCQDHGGKFEAAAEKAALLELNQREGTEALQEKLRQISADANSVAVALQALAPKASQDTSGERESRIVPQKSVSDIVAGLQAVREGLK